MTNLATLKRWGFHGPKQGWEWGSCPFTWPALLGLYTCLGSKSPLVDLS